MAATTIAKATWSRPRPGSEVIAKPKRSGHTFALVVLVPSLLLLWWPTTVHGQYDWSSHLGPTPTGFELTRFGTWDLDVIPLRGMVDRDYYGSDLFSRSGIRKIVETTHAQADSTGSATIFRHSISHLDRQGRITRVEYLDPLTRNVIQREMLGYDSEGRLVSWRRARPPSEVSIASVTRTLYPGRGPYGMSQTFKYDLAGTLREWRACTVSMEQRLEQCEEDYVAFDETGRITGYGMTGTHYTITRDPDGNARRIEERGADGEVTNELTISVDVRTVAETVARDTLDAGNFGWLDDQGRMIQYRVSMPDAPEYYWTATWTYDRQGRPLNIRKGFDTFDFKYDAAGRLIGVEQSRQPASVYRTYNAQGRLRSQEPPLFYGRLDASFAGEERYAYDARGFLTAVSVRNKDGQQIAQTELDYVGRDRN